MTPVPHDVTGVSESGLPVTGDAASHLGAWRRGADIVIGLAGCVVLAAVSAVVAPLIRKDSSGPVFYSAQRLGRDAAPIRILKFRSMYEGSDAGSAITAAGDPRVTRVGRWLRRTKIDEIPQFVNLLTGEITLVGPRPEDPRMLHAYTGWRRSIFELTPGITSAGTLLYTLFQEEQLEEMEESEAVYVDGLLDAKLRLDMSTLSRRSLRCDAIVVCLTLLAALSRRAARRAFTRLEDAGVFGS
ncbi:MAG: sugar transferase [Acidimicrobiia bacterium]|nr:sugar transferase [Acidimicrobiia bacterium]